MSIQYYSRKHIIFTVSALVGFALIACTESSGVQSFDEPIDAGLAPNPSSSIELRAIGLASGLIVDVHGPAMAFDALPASPTAAQLCEEFALSLTATFDENQQPLAYAASAMWRGMERTSDPSLVQGLVGYLAPLFPDVDIPTDFSFGGIGSNPIAISPIALSSTDTTPQALAIHHYQTKAPMAVFNHSSIGEHNAFPRTWYDASSAAAAPVVEVWSRYIEGAESLANCDGYAEVIEMTMNLSVVEELASCGEIMAWPYSLSDPALSTGINGGCMTPSQGAYPCPRPQESTGYYACFKQSDS